MSNGKGYEARRAWLDYAKDKFTASLSGPTPCLDFEHFLGATLQSNLSIFPKDVNRACFLLLRAFEYSRMAKPNTPLFFVFDKANFWGKTETLTSPQELLGEFHHPTGRALFIEPKLFSKFVAELLAEHSNRDIFRRFESDIFFWSGLSEQLKPAMPFLLTFVEKANLRFVCGGRSAPANFVMLSDAVVYSEHPWHVRTHINSAEVPKLLALKGSTSTLGGFNLKG